ncbi:hypothetical protein Dda_9218 [Drechslerella dactyloides]|uniref:triacylglycerol lipase n=1 Tax=Drechslerella dactyloides TaxID=74499 RepID=A0AAD6ISF6_DREDA|nr:hypothetical protein Dda_9218 [Drechslerella dactyloides]
MTLEAPLNYVTFFITALKADCSNTSRYPNLLRRLDVNPGQETWKIDAEHSAPIPKLTARSRSINMHRMRDRSVLTIENRLAANRLGVYQFLDTPAAWTTDEVLAPDVEDKETVLNLAKMSANAYVHVPATEDWRDLGTPWNQSAGFGWENDGLRGHIFLDPRNTTLIISIKGTSVAVFYGEETKTNDKINDNLFFSCCCARVSAFWRTVCDCYTDTYSCSSPCLSNALKEESRYYRAALNLYYNVSQLYPDAKNVWVVGHSLGGAVSSLLGMTYGLPVVTFEAPPEALAATRLGIPKPPTGAHIDGVYHFGNNADPIYMGVCNGATSFCSIGGYAMETKCHSGKVCLYDVVNDFGWRINGNSHRIKTVIDEVMPKYDRVPDCVPEDEECIDCFNWKFHNRSITSTTTSSSHSSHSTTRTSTCQHPGWWGCLDETTTSTTIQTTKKSTTTATSTTTSKTCSHYGWFGNCLDTTHPKNPATATSTVVTITTSTQPSSVTSQTTSTASSTILPSTSCTKPGFFWGCRD